MTHWKVYAVYRIFAAAIIILLFAGTASAAVVTLPNETQTTSFAATVSSQANVTIPAGITFTVTNVSADTASAAQTVNASVIVVPNGNELYFQIKANAANFTPATGGTVTWAATDVTWNAATWTNGSGSSGTMSSAAYNLVSLSNANPGSTSTSNLVFTLGDKATVDRAGNHTLVCTWKIMADS